jgi:hypothetical protein
MHLCNFLLSQFVKNKNNINTLVSKSEFKIIVLIAIFGVILISSIPTLNNKGIVILAQSNTSTNSTSSSQSDNQTSGVDKNTHSKLPKSALDLFNEPPDIIPRFAKKLS